METSRLFNTLAKWHKWSWAANAIIIKKQYSSSYSPSPITILRPTPPRRMMPALGDLHDGRAEGYYNYYFGLSLKQSPTTGIIKMSTHSAAAAHDDHAEVMMMTYKIPLENTSLAKVVARVFDDMTLSGNMINDFYEDIIMCKDPACIPPDVLSAITKFREEFAADKAHLTSEIQTAIAEIESGSSSRGESDDVLEQKILEKFYSSKISPVKIKEALSKWRYLEDKIAFARHLVDNLGVIYIGQGRKKEEDITHGISRKGYDADAAAAYVIYFFSFKSKSNDEDHWDRNLRLFSQLSELRHHGNYSCFAVDCDIHKLHNKHHLHDDGDGSRNSYIQIRNTSMLSSVEVVTLILGNLAMNHKRRKNNGKNQRKSMERVGVGVAC